MCNFKDINKQFKIYGLQFICLRVKRSLEEKSSEMYFHLWSTRFGKKNSVQENSREVWIQIHLVRKLAARGSQIRKRRGRENKSNLRGRKTSSFWNSGETRTSSNHEFKRHLSDRRVPQELGKHRDLEQSVRKRVECTKTVLLPLPDPHSPGKTPQQKITVGKKRRCSWSSRQEIGNLQVWN